MQNSMKEMGQTLSIADQRMLHNGNTLPAMGASRFIVQLGTF